MEDTLPRSARTWALIGMFLANLYLDLDSFQRFVSSRKEGNGAAKDVLPKAFTPRVLRRQES